MGQGAQAASPEPALRVVEERLLLSVVPVWAPRTRPSPPSPVIAYNISVWRQGLSLSRQSLLLSGEQGLP